MNGNVIWKRSVLVTRSIATRWLGVYCYDHDFHAPDLYADTKFEMTFAIGWFGRLSGTIVDAEPGIAEPASIRGWITRFRIAFKKQYASLWVPDESGNLSAIPGQKSYVLNYVGDIVDNGTRLTGTWQIPSQRRWIDGSPWDFPTCTGTWSAKSLIE